MLFAAAVLFAACSSDDDWAIPEALEQEITKINSDIAKLKTIAMASEQGVGVEEYTETSGAVSVLLTDGTSIAVSNFGEGNDAPSIGVNSGYWTVSANGKSDWLQDPAGSRIPVSSGTTPQLGIDAKGYWTVNSIRVTLSGEPIKVEGEKAGAIFATVEKRGSKINFKLSDGSEIALAYEAFLVFTFEDVPSEYLAGPTSYGENIYTGYTGQQFITYTDPASNLVCSINEGYDGKYNFWNGGIAVSRWNDVTTVGFMNQCSAYYSDATTGFGGYGGSRTFGVVNGETVLYFADEDREAVFDHFWITNSTYLALSLKYGDDMGKKFTYEDQDWFRLAINGYDKDGTLTGTIYVYLADFRTAASPGILEGWEPVELSSLGAVHSLSFAYDSSDVGDWGVNNPTYFCMDNVAIRK